MHLTEPKVFLLAKPMINEEGMRAWLDHLGAQDYAVHKAQSEAESMVMAFAKRCYMSFEPGLNPNVQKVREDVSDYLDNILRSKHGSVLEHAHFSFGIEGVSRVFTGEMNRHRAGMAISEGSMRFISFDDLGLVETTGMKEPKDQYDDYIAKYLTTAFDSDEKLYSHAMEHLRELGYDELPMPRKKELTSRMRRAIGMGISTGGVWTGNIRALRHICELRGQSFAEEEILVVAQQILAIMVLECPNLFGDFSVDSKGFWSPTYSKV